MKKTVLLLWVGNLLGLSCLAQDGYTISGRVRGIATDKVYVVAADFGKADTLASAAVTNGNFLLQGTVPGDARAVNLVFAGVEDNIPLLLENTTYQLQVSTGNALLNGGGKAAELYKAFNKIGQDYATAQSAIMEEYESSDGNPAKEDALQFCHSAVMRLYDYDREHDTNLLESLRIYLTHNRSICERYPGRIYEIRDEICREITPERQ